MADTEKLKQVFVNLIVNAAEAMPSGGTLDIKTEQSENLVTVTFSDTGEGIDLEEKSKIFDPFYHGQ